ncbi:MAG: hypothetical protein MHM6MM_005830 [Cercozoa sp. M6MM]
MSGDSVDSMPRNFRRGRRLSVSAEVVTRDMMEQAERNIADFLDNENRGSNRIDEEERRRIEIELSSLFMFASLSESELNAVIRAMTLRAVSAGERVITQGDDGDYFYVVKSGTFVADIDGNQVKRYDNGGYFGELALLHCAPRAASVTACTDGELWALDRRSFRAIHVTSNSRRQRTILELLKRSPLCRDVETSKLRELADAAEIVVFRDGDVVIRKEEDFGESSSETESIYDNGKRFFLVQTGRADVYLSSDTVGERSRTSSISSGDFFGERAFLLDAPRAATIVARGRLLCAAWSENAFRRLFCNLPSVLRQLQRRVRSYDTTLESVAELDSDE